MIPKPQIEIIYPDGKKEYVPLEWIGLDYEDGVIQSLNPEVKPTVTQLESAKVPLNHQLMDTMKEINNMTLEL